MSVRVWGVMAVQYIIPGSRRVSLQSREQCPVMPTTEWTPQMEQELHNNPSLLIVLLELWEANI